MKVGDKFLNSDGEPMTIFEIEKKFGYCYIRLNLDKEKDLPLGNRFVTVFQLRTEHPEVVTVEEFQGLIARPRKEVNVDRIGDLKLYDHIDRVCHPEKYPSVSKDITVILDDKTPDIRFIDQNNMPLEPVQVLMDLSAGKTMLILQPVEGYIYPMNKVAIVPVNANSSHSTDQPREPTPAPSS